MLGLVNPLLYLSMGVYVGIWIAQNHSTPPLESPLSLVMRAKQWITGESSSDCSNKNEEPPAKKPSPSLELLAKKNPLDSMKSLLDAAVGGGDKLI